MPCLFFLQKLLRLCSPGVRFRRSLRLLRLTSLGLMPLQQRASRQLLQLLWRTPRLLLGLCSSAVRFRCFLRLMRLTCPMLMRLLQCSSRRVLLRLQRCRR